MMASILRVYVISMCSEGWKDENLGRVHVFAPLEVQGRKSQFGGGDPLQRQTQLGVDAPWLQVAVGHLQQQQQLGLSAALCCPG